MSQTNQAEAKSGWRRRWPLIKKILTYVFFALIVGLLIGLARNLDWAEVYKTLRNYQAQTLWMAGAAAFGSYLVYCFFDVLGKGYARHDLPIRQILPVTFVCYAFNLNLSAWVGGIALRFRLYSRLGLKPSQITRVFTMSILTNWLGYMWLAGMIFSMGWIQPPASWEIGFTALRVLGAGLLVACVVYLWLCGFSKRRSWTIRGHEIQLPSLRLALIQLVLGAANWSLMARRHRGGIRGNARRRDEQRRHRRRSDRLPGHLLPDPPAVRHPRLCGARSPGEEAAQQQPGRRPADCLSGNGLRVSEAISWKIAIRDVLRSRPGPAATKADT